jgi:hypothetical protein
MQRKPPATPCLGYEFQTVFITNIDWTGGASAGTTEALTFAFGAMVMAFGPTNPDGPPAPVIRQGHGKVVNSGGVTSPMRAVRSVRRCTL